MKWPQPRPFVFPIHLDKAYDLGISPVFRETDTYLDEA